MPATSSSPLASSAIRRLYYDTVRHNLHVSFKGSGDYTYFDVPPEVAEALTQAASKGAFINQRIKGRYRCTRRDAPKRRIWLDEQRRPFRENSA